MMDDIRGIAKVQNVFWISSGSTIAVHYTLTDDNMTPEFSVWLQAMKTRLDYRESLLFGILRQNPHNKKIVAFLWQFLKHRSSFVSA